MEAIRRARIVRFATSIDPPPLLSVIKYAAVPTGIIRGALSRLGYNSTVTPEITSLPQCMSVDFLAGLNSYAHRYIPD